MGIYCTGNEIVDGVAEINFSGNIIPQAWYKTVTKTNGKPNMRAMLFLSDIVYWYRPTEIRDETTGSTIGVRKKMKSDLLQRSYQDLAEQFGCTKGEATTSIVELENLGVLKRVFRTEIHNGVRSNNIMYIELHVDILKQLTFPNGDANARKTPVPKKRDSSPKAFDTPIPKNQDSLSQKKETAIPENRETNTETISKSTTEISHKITQSIRPSTDVVSFSSDGLSESELIKIVDKEITDNKGIPYTYKQDERKMQTAIRLLTDWYELTEAHFSSAFQKSTYDLLVDCMIEMACADGIQVYKGSHVSYAKVLDKINDCSQEEHGLYNYVEETIDDYISAAKVNEIHDKRKYMKSVIWNSMSTYKVKFESNFARTFSFA